MLLIAGPGLVAVHQWAEHGEPVWLWANWAVCALRATGSWGCCVCDVGRRGERAEDGKRGKQGGGVRHGRLGTNGGVILPRNTLQRCSTVQYNGSIKVCGVSYLYRSPVPRSAVSGRPRSGAGPSVDGGAGGPGTRGELPGPHMPHTCTRAAVRLRIPRRQRGQVPPARLCEARRGRGRARGPRGRRGHWRRR